MKKKTEKKSNEQDKFGETVEWFLKEIAKEYNITRARAITMVEKYLEENW